mmetsp:Transcript_32006/g.72098  ORF Transcript_32006/g.72098 Transcript_32006/m.72098 type:complete len:315 (+) Transcript_32006:887-1831(+)
MLRDGHRLFFVHLPIPATRLLAQGLVLGLTLHIAFLVFKLKCALKKRLYVNCDHKHEGSASPLAVPPSPVQVVKSLVGIMGEAMEEALAVAKPWVRKGLGGRCLGIAQQLRDFLRQTCGTPQQLDEAREGVVVAGLLLEELQQMGHGAVRVLLREAQVRQHKHGLLPRSHHGRATEVATEVLLPHVARGLVAEGPRIRTFVLLYPDYRLALFCARLQVAALEVELGQQNHSFTPHGVSSQRLIVAFHHELLSRFGLEALVGRSFGGAVKVRDPAADVTHDSPLRLEVLLCHRRVADHAGKVLVLYMFGALEGVE